MHNTYIGVSGMHKKARMSGWKFFFTLGIQYESRKYRVVRISRFPKSSTILRIFQDKYYILNIKRMTGIFKP